MSSAIRISWRLGAIAVVLVAAFAITSVDRHAAASRAAREGVEEACLEDGGIYYEDYVDGELVSYGCYYLDGDEYHCAFTDLCVYIYGPDPARAPEPTYEDPYSPVQSLPTDSYQSGNEYQMAGR